MSKRIAIIDAETMIVVNVIMANDDYIPPIEHMPVASETAGPGDIYDMVNDTFTPPPPEPEPLPTDLGDYQRAIERHVDMVAAEKQYGGAVSIATYVNSTIPQWKAEAEAFVTWRDGVYYYAITELAKVENGEREQPTIADFIAELQVIEWPI